MHIYIYYFIDGLYEKVMEFNAVETRLRKKKKEKKGRKICEKRENREKKKRNPVSYEIFDKLFDYTSSPE